MVKKFGDLTFKAYYGWLVAIDGKVLLIIFLSMLMVNPSKTLV